MYNNIFHQILNFKTSPKCTSISKEQRREKTEDRCPGVIMSKNSENEPTRQVLLKHFDPKGNIMNSLLTHVASLRYSALLAVPLLGGLPPTSLET